MTKFKIFIAVIIIFQFAELSSKSIRITSKNSISYGLENSDIIFLGEFLNSDTSGMTYSFRILESFKGHNKSDTIYGKAESDYSIFPNDLGLWIVYANYNKDSITINIHYNSPTRAMKWQNYFGPPPPPKLYSDNFKSDKMLDRRIDDIERYNDGLRDWFYDLERLRKYKDSNRVPAVKKQFDYKLMLLIFSFVLNILMFTIIITKLMKK